MPRRIVVVIIIVSPVRVKYMNQSGGIKCDEGGISEESSEDQEESSSSSPSSPLSSTSCFEPIEDALISFRKQWQSELNTSPMVESQDNNLIEVPNDNISKEELLIENQAKNLFLKGIEYEQNGKLYDAIKFYKRAVQLVPDIEFRLYQSTKLKVKEKIKDGETLQELTSDNHSAFANIDENNDGDEDDLLEKLSRIISCNKCVCYPHFEQNMMHISALPMEIVLYILRWVVSSELDLHSLEMFSRVCRGFFICARDPEIWKLACAKVWGVNCGNYEPKYHSWREMYLERPRLRFNGCYISKTTYIRQGENSFQDEFYRPWHFVEYFRYLRFFPEGRVLMLTSTDEMQNCVTALKNRNPRNASVLMGHYRLHNNYVTLVLKKQEVKVNNSNVYRKKRREVVHDSGEQTFHVEFDIQSYRKRAHWQLNWVRYDIFTKYKNGQETSMCLNDCGRYPPFKFSRVKSYMQESETHL